MPSPTDADDAIRAGADVLLGNNTPATVEEIVAGRRRALIRWCYAGDPVVAEVSFDSLAPATPLVFSIGGYPHVYKPRTAGDFGCDPCWSCETGPAAGARIWMNCYGDLYCDACARRNAAEHKAREEETGEVCSVCADRAETGPASLTFVHGRWPSIFTPRMTRATGDDLPRLCWYCGLSLVAGKAVWVNPYGEHVCHTCARPRAAKFYSAEWRSPDAGNGRVHGLAAGSVVRLDDKVTTHEVTAIYPDAGLVDLRGHVSGEVRREVRVELVDKPGNRYHGRARMLVSSERIRGTDGSVGHTLDTYLFRTVDYPRYGIPVFGKAARAPSIMKRWSPPRRVKDGFTPKPFGIGGWLEAEVDGERVPAQVICPPTMNEPGAVVAVTGAGNVILDLVRYKNAIGTRHRAGREDVYRIADPFTDPEQVAV
jgi:hypothetical protein